MSGSVEADPVADGFVLTGTVAPVEAGGQATHLLVGATTPDGPAQFLVAVDTPGVSVTPRRSLDLVRRFATVDLVAVAVDGAAVVTGPGASDAPLARQFELACALQLAETTGAIDRVLEFTVEWAFDRYSFGRPLASYQALKHRFADMRLWLEACMATTTAAVRAVQAEATSAGELISVAKAYVGAHAPELVQDCVQMHGGIGVTWDHDIHLYLRRVTLNAELYGTVAEHRRRLAALDGLGPASGAGERSI
jgi:alkylation response protein AidB-like acyl-CoA dehydrogenase